MIHRTLWESAVELQSFLASSGYPFCFIGGIAYQRWGEPRTTEDLDATILTDFGKERDVIEMVLRRYQSRVPDAASFAVQARILLIQDLAGSPIDLSIGGLPYEHAVVRRSTLWQTPASGSIRTCCAEDLVVLKAFAARPQDWIDVEKVIVRQGDRLDRELGRMGQNALAMQTHQPQIVDSHGGSARLTPLDPPDVLKTHSPIGIAG